MRTFPGMPLPPKRTCVSLSVSGRAPRRPRPFWDRQKKHAGTPGSDLGLAGCSGLSTKLHCSPLVQSRLGPSGLRWILVLNQLQPARPKSTWGERAAVDLPIPIGFSNCAFGKMVGFCWKTALSEVSDLSSRGHFVDLGQENTSV